MERFEKLSLERWAGFFFALMILAQATWASQIPPQFSTGSDHGLRIRVRLADHADQVQVRGLDLHFYEILGPGKRKWLRTLKGSTEWQVRCLAGAAGKVQIGAETFSTPFLIQTPAGFLNFKNRPYRDELTIYSKNGSCEVVNSVALEKYLDGLVSSEISASWNEAAIEAQVVAARTYALYQIEEVRRNHPSAHFDVEASVKDQVYEGSLGEDYRASQGVEKTRGMVLTANSANGPQPLKAFYHSTCGGYTELPQNVWGAKFPGFKHAVKCDFCKTSPRFNWDLDMSGRDISAALLKGAQTDGNPTQWPRLWAEVLQQGKLLEVRANDLNAQMRVSPLTTVWNYQGRNYELAVAGAKFRSWVGWDKLRSTYFQVAEKHGFFSTHWHFTGHGSGHGVGMCQWGAKSMAEKGYKMAAILKYYYPDATLRKLW